MVAPAPKRATYDDILNAPDNVVAEIVDGELHLSPRPATGHAHTATVLTEEIGPPFRRGRGGPGGWHFLFEPELHFGTDVLVPDIAGWRTTRMPTMISQPFFTLAPDWVCEVVSPRTSEPEKLSLPGSCSIDRPARGRAARSHPEPEPATSSPQGLDRNKKMPIYAREQVGHAWLIDPVERVLEVHRLENGRWSMLANHFDGDRVRAEPFEAIELDLSVLWAAPDPDAR